MSIDLLTIYVLIIGLVAIDLLAIEKFWSIIVLTINNSGVFISKWTRMLVYSAFAAIQIQMNVNFIRPEITLVQRKMNMDILHF